MEGIYKMAFKKGKEILTKGKTQQRTKQPEPEKSFLEKNKTFLLIGAGALALILIIKNQ